jgi:uridine phosphorylase
MTADGRMRPVQGDPGGWEVDDSEPIITPEGALAYYGRLLGETGNLALPDLLVATFQATALQHIAGRIGVDVVERWPTPIFWPLARGSFRGRELAIARLPIGAPSAASALELVIAAGVRTVLVVGSAGSIHPDIELGSLVIATRAVRNDGTSYHYLSEGELAEPSTALVDALASSAASHHVPAALGPIWTTDAPYRECAATVARLRAKGVVAVEMEAAALFAVGRYRGARVAMIAAISDELREGWNPGFHTLSYRRAIVTAADIALDAASRIPSPPSS